MSKKKLATALLAAGLSAAVGAAFAQTDAGGGKDAPKKAAAISGAAIFKAKCMACHTIGGGNRVGPDLKGATDRDDDKWLAGYIAKPSAYLKNDPKAKALLKKFHGVPMPDLGLSPDQVQAMIQYLKAAGKAKPKKA